MRGLAVLVSGSLGYVAGSAARETPTAAEVAPPSAIVRTPLPTPPPPEPLTPCGARTKKGTRCKRLVRGGGRCWQHGGER